MISWIQRTFQHHFRTVFAVLLAITIISFIFVIGASPGIGRADRQVLKRPFFGLNLSSQQDQQRIFGDAGLSIYLQYGYQPPDNAQIQEYALMRQAALALADQLHVPEATSSEITDSLKNLRLFAGDNGQFDPKKYTEFRDSLRKNTRLNEAEVSRVLSDNVRVEKVQKLLSGPGYVLPEDVKKQLEQAESTWTLAVATVDYASFKPTITPSEADLTKFFQDNVAKYRVPPQVRVSYASFPASAFVSQVNVSEAEIRAFYDANPARFPKPAVKTPTPTPGLPPTPTPTTDPAADYAFIRPQVEAALKLERAGALASKAAADFSVALYEQKLAPGTAAFDAFLAAHKLTLKDLPPFSSEAPPAELGGNPQIAEEAFKLDKDRLVSDPLTTDNGAVVLFWKESISARDSSFAEVRTKVLADYVDSEKRKRFVELGKTLKTQLETHLKTGEAFDKAVAAIASSASVKIDAKTYPPFTLRQRPQDLDYLAYGALETLQAHAVSDMSVGPDKGLLVYAQDKKLPDLSEKNPQFVTTRNQIAQVTSARNAGEYLRELVDRELAKTAALAPQ